MLVDPTRIHALGVFEVRGVPDQRGVLLRWWNLREGSRGADPGAVPRWPPFEALPPQL